MKAGEELGGPNATGKPGDYVLENDEVAFVIEALGHSAGFGVSGGNLIDAADAQIAQGRDRAGVHVLRHVPSPGRLRIDRHGRHERRQRVGRVKGHELNEAKVAVDARATRCTRRIARSLIDTTLENTGDQPVIFLGLGDAIQWGGAEKFAPDRGRGFKGRSSGSVSRGRRALMRATRSRRRTARSTRRAGPAGATRCKHAAPRSPPGKACTIHACSSSDRARTCRGSSRS